MTTAQNQYARPTLSVVLPCYRAAKVARASVEAIMSSLSHAPYSWEILIVDDGGKDFTDPAWPDHPQVILIRLPHNKGKGAAVRAGMLAARGEVRIFTDIDLPFGVGVFSLMLEYIVERGFHLVVGDRTMAQSQYRLHIPMTRRLASAAFSSLVGRIVTGGYYDTQCGLKAVRGDVADALFPLLQVSGFAFDVELIYIALKHKADIKRIPVVLETNLTSSVRILHDSWRSGLDILRVRMHQARGRYTSTALSELLASDIRRTARTAAKRW